MSTARPVTAPPQIKSRERVRNLAEVYTNPREVNAMLDLIPDMFPATVAGADIKFLEPACGSGNFLVEILRRKLAVIRSSEIRATEAYEHRILRAVASIYGVDICPENVEESKARMFAGVQAHRTSGANVVEPSRGFVSAARAILGTNILCANMLTDASSTEVIDYRPGGDGTFTRVWSMLDSSSDSPAPGRSHQGRRGKRDEVPVHFSMLAMTPEPARLTCNFRAEAA